MNIIQILTLILTYKNEIVELIKLIERLFGQNVYADVADIEATATAVAGDYPSLAQRVNLGELIRFLLENKDDIIELIDFIKTLFKGE